MGKQTVFELHPPHIPPQEPRSYLQLWLSAYLHGDILNTVVKDERANDFFFSFILLPFEVIATYCKYVFVSLTF